MSGQEESDRRPNVVLLTADCLRADRLGSYGNSRRLTPFMDSLADGGVRFRNCFATGPHTSASFPGLLASSFHTDADVLHLDGTMLPCEEPRERVFLAEVLAEHGYHTIGLNSNPNLVLARGFERGFSRFHDLEGEVSSIQRLGQAVRSTLETLGISTSSRLYDWIKGLFRGTVGYGPALNYVPGDRLNQLALRLIAEAPRPWFLWVHYLEPHIPLVPPARLRKRLGCDVSDRKIAELTAKHRRRNPESYGERDRTLIRNLYDAEVAHVDEKIRDLVTALGDEGQLQDSMVVVTADHGEELGEHGYFDHATMVSAHEPKLHDVLLHVPLLMRDFRRSGQGRVVESVTSLLDLAPTVAELAGCGSPSTWRGESLVAAMQGDEERLSRDRSVLSEFVMKRHEEGYGLAVSCRGEQWKLVHDALRDVWHLFDMKADPGEKTDLSGQGVDAEGELRSLLESHVASRSIRFDQGVEVEIDERMRERMRRMGYMS